MGGGQSCSHDFLLEIWFKDHKRSILFRGVNVRISVDLPHCELNIVLFLTHKAHTATASIMPFIWKLSPVLQFNFKSLASQCVTRSSAQLSLGLTVTHCAHQLYKDGGRCSALAIELQCRWSTQDLLRLLPRGRSLKAES